MRSAYKDASKQADEKKRGVTNFNNHSGEKDGKIAEDLLETMNVKDTQCKYCKRGLISALAISVVINVVFTSMYFSVKEDRGAQYFCPDNWIGFQDKCYYFSEEEKDWNSSRYDCLSQNASLVMIATTKEKHFLKRFKCTSDHWIWQDMTENLTGQWADENIHNKGTNMTGNEICFYLNEDDVATARCYTERKWICRKKCTESVSDSGLNIQEYALVIFNEEQ